MSQTSKIFKRKIYDELLRWKQESNGTTALLIEGARRVGKSTVVEEFGRNAYKSYLIIDFANPKKDTISLFEDGIGKDFDGFFMRLQLIEDVVLHTRDSLIIFDEVQSYPKARQLIKYLVKDGRYDYIETGSLISLKKNITRITLPSEEESITMYPMDFEEFLWAQGDESTIPFIKNAFDRRSPVGNGVHRNILRKYREYIAVGGMPQVVSAFIDNKDFGSIDREKRLIWTLYENDVEKIPSPTDSKVSTILKRIPNMLSKINKRFSPGMIRMGSGMDEYDSSLEWLEQSRIVNICKNVNDPNLTLPLEMEANKVKCYLLDTGLLIYRAMMENNGERNWLYKSIILDKLSINEGMFFENMVAQELRASGHGLYHHRFEVEGCTRPYEVDFLLTSGKKVIPIEVKSGRSKPHASLSHFIEKYSDRCGESFVIHTKDLMVEGGITYIPIYMTMFL